MSLFRSLVTRGTLLGLIALLKTACGSDSTLLIVELPERSTTVQSLRLTATLNSQRVMPEEQVMLSAETENFGLLLSPEAAGTFLLTADGLDKDRCVVSQGKTETVLSGRPRVRLRLEMTNLPTRFCSEQR